MRFKPLNPGPMRNCAADYTIAAGTPRATRIRKGAKLLAGTQSAMFDERRVIRPNEFNPNRPASNFMLFGYGLHWCLGAFIAEVQITQTLKALLLTKGLRRAPGKAGQLHLLGPFPEHLVVEFADPRA
jgi:cytochrome P450